MKLLHLLEEEEIAIPSLEDIYDESPVDPDADETTDGNETASEDDALPDMGLDDTTTENSIELLAEIKHPYLQLDIFKPGMTPEEIVSKSEADLNKLVASCKVQLNKIVAKLKYGYDDDLEYKSWSTVQSFVKKVIEVKRSRSTFEEDEEETT